MRTIANNLVIAAVIALSAGPVGSAEEPVAEEKKEASFIVRPIGQIKRDAGKTFIVLDKRYQPGLLGIEKREAIWVLWWFDQNDTPARRATLQVHPFMNDENPLTGVFAARAAVRPNLIALTPARILSVKDNIIEIDDIDAFNNTPVIDIKPLAANERYLGPAAKEAR